jgi:hypothetical protein
MRGSIMHISGGFWANSSKGEDAKPPVYGTLLGCDGIWNVAQVWVDPRTAGLPVYVGLRPRQYPLLINSLLKRSKPASIVAHSPDDRLADEIIHSVADRDGRHRYFISFLIYS